MSCPQLLYTGFQKNIGQCTYYLETGPQEALHQPTEAEETKTWLFWFTDQTVKQAYKRNKS